MTQGVALEIMLSGESVFLTGQAGAGKTYVLNEFIRHAKAEGKKVAVTATTGLAATHLGGNTIHAWSGIGIFNELPSRFFDHMSKSRGETIKTTDILIIDEISMLHDYRLDMVDQVARRVRDIDEPFGGIQVILCGDFFQLPPVNRDGSPSGGFVVHSNVWRELEPVICYLSEQHRQDDPMFLDILTAIRGGDVRRHHAEALLNRVDAHLGGEQEVTELHTMNIDVDSINQTALQQLEGDEYAYEMHTTGSDNYVEQLKRSCLAPEELVLRTGALVMCIKNSQDRKYVNGSLGIVVDFEPLGNYPVVQLRNGKEVTITPDTWELRDGNKKRASLSQLPLRLAWAITIHKSQGMTLDAARIDLRRAFVEGMGYVALSRVKRLDSLSLIGINKKALEVSPDALRINDYLLEKSKLDYERFKDLEHSAVKRKERKPAARTASGKPTIDQIRIDYPKAGTRWQDAEDDQLKKMFEDGAGATDISAALQRQPGAIRMRLQKHYGEEVIIPG